jgi:hypothetical protein
MACTWDDPADCLSTAAAPWVITVSECRYATTVAPLGHGGKRHANDERVAPEPMLSEAQTTSAPVNFLESVRASSLALTFPYTSLLIQLVMGLERKLFRLDCAVF